ncbi:MULTISPECIES: enoyl-CoA hydratase/isomerase family protein [unclassified Aeromicrobium]|uniref:enoyl-CoA hydratase/isomerase family protein n=1 Tax=unclassified Aeromicrobium TaxID=2633570 RepID=UPI00396B075C
MTGRIGLDRVGAVAVITVDNTRIKNALTQQMARDLGAVCEEIDADASIGCTVIQGAGGTFCSGADTSTWAETYGDDPLSDEAYADTDEMYGSFVRFGELKAPTIAAVRGAAVGAGLNLALAADLRVASEDARLLAGFLAAGIHPGGGFFTLVRRLAGREAAATLGLFSQEVSGREAKGFGLVGVCVPDEDTEKTALEIAQHVARDPLVARRAKRSFNLETQSTPLPWAAALEVERGVQLWTQARRLRHQREQA